MVVLILQNKIKIKRWGDVYRLNANSMKESETR